MWDPTPSYPTYHSSFPTVSSTGTSRPPFRTSLHAQASRCGSMDASPRTSGLENTSLVPAYINIPPHLSSQWSCSHILPPRPCRGLPGLSFSLLRSRSSSGQGTCSGVPCPARLWIRPARWHCPRKQKHLGFLNDRMVEMPEYQNIHIHLFCQIAQAFRMVCCQLTRAKKLKWVTILAQF